MKYSKTPINNHTITYDEIYYEGKVKVPFSWEYKPGFPKVNHQNFDTNHDTKLVLQPPPCSLSKKLPHRDEENLCVVQRTLRRASSFKMESRSQKDEDPFVEAYKKCTKSPFIVEAYKKCTKSPFLVQGKNRDQKNNWFNFRKYMHFLSCKYCDDVINHRVVYV